MQERIRLLEAEAGQIREQQSVVLDNLWTEEVE
jgi:hypothetical protein